jgi:hypothetical protein
VAEKWGQKNEGSPLRSKRGGGVYDVSDPDISATVFEKSETAFA